MSCYLKCLVFRLSDQFKILGIFFEILLCIQKNIAFFANRNKNH
jgi:hypothetical protein